MSLARNVHYELADGVKVDRTSAQAYEVEDAASESDVVALAKALGVPGDVKVEKDGVDSRHGRTTALRLAPRRPGVLDVFATRRLIGWLCACADLPVDEKPTV